MYLSIRWRLTLWYVLALAIVLIGFGTLVYALLASSLYRRIDHVLLTEFQEAEEESNRSLPNWIGETHEHERVSCIVYDPTGQVYLKTNGLSSASLQPASFFVPRPDGLGDAIVPGLGHQRFLIGKLSLEGGQFTAVLMAPLTEIDAELGQVLSILGLAVPASLLVAGALGYLMARKALAPMAQLYQLTEDITADRLDRRLPQPHSLDEVGRLTQTINAMIGRLERSFAEIRRFTADASHELRTPLSVIRMEAEVALREPLAASDYQQLLGSILEECERLARLTDQLLALSRQDAGAQKSAREPVQLVALLNDVTDTMRPLAEAKGVDINCALKSRPQVFGDEERLREVFYNLLDNAIKYTPSGGTIAVELSSEARDAVIRVCDTGIGIPAPDLPRVFDRFYRVDKARSREQGGTGLGLSIAQSIIHAHGGSIELESGPGQGTTCTVKLPALSTSFEGDRRDG
jgi:heavy metal sensor kinase